LLFYQQLINNLQGDFNMIGLLKKLFGGKPAEQTAEAPYKVETAPVVEAAPAPSVEAVVVPEAVVPAAVVEQAPAKQPAKKPAPKKQQFAKKPAAPKTAKPKTQPKPKAKPAV